MVNDLRWIYTGFTGNKEKGYTITYKMWWDAKTYRIIDLHLQEIGDISPIRKNNARICLLLEKVIELSGYKTKGVSYSTFLDWELNKRYITEDTLYML